MSYAGKTGHGERGAKSAGRTSAPARLASRGLQESTARQVSSRPLSLRTTPARQKPGNPPGDHGHEVDWHRVAIFATGVALGLTLGAGATLLLAPKSGEEIRNDIARRGRRLRSHSLDAWEDLREDLGRAARRGRRKLVGAVRRMRQPDDDMLDQPARTRVAG